VKNALLLTAGTVLLALAGCRNPLSQELRKLPVKLEEATPERCVLTGNHTRAVLRPGSARLELSGTPVILPQSVQRSPQGVYSLPEDVVQSILSPLLFPPARRAVSTILLDPGHGGSDRGALCVDKSTEKELNLLLALALRDELTKRGFRVYLTRNADRTLALAQRGVLAKNCKADLFISVHHNSGTNSDAAGVETFVLRPPDPAQRTALSLPYALVVHRAMVCATRTSDRGVKFANFRVLRDAECPGILIEAGFLSHKVEGPRCSDPVRRAGIAAAIADALLPWKREQSR